MAQSKSPIPNWTRNRYFRRYSYKIMVDNCCSACITNQASDFVSTPTLIQLRVNGIGGLLIVSGKGLYYMQQHGGLKPSWYTCGPTRYVLPTLTENLHWSYFLILEFAHVWTCLSLLDVQFTNWTTTYKQGRRSSSGTSVPALVYIWVCHPSTLGCTESTDRHGIIDVSY